MKRLPPAGTCLRMMGSIEQLDANYLAEENVKLVEKGIENTGQMTLE